MKTPSLDKQGIQALLTPQGEGSDQLKVQFRSAANRCVLIYESGYQSILVKYLTETNQELEALLGKLAKAGPERWPMRKLQRYSVSVPQYQFKAHFEIRDHSPDNPPTKFSQMFERRAAKGQCFNQPYLGSRELAADFRLAKGHEQVANIPDELYAGRTGPRLDALRPGLRSSE